MPPRASGQRATASRTSRVIVLTLPMTRSCTIGGKVTTARSTSQRSTPFHGRAYHRAATPSTTSLMPIQAHAAAVALKGTRGTNSRAPSGV